MELSFYENLSTVQKNYAKFIADRAKALGVPPELAVAIAYKESGLNPTVQPGAAGEIGIMQIKPATAKEMGFSADEIRDPTKNIDAGLKYLKKSLEMSEGNPQLAAAGYNAGVNHPFFSSSEKSLPDTTVKYLRDLNQFGAFQAPTVGQAEPGQAEPGEEYSEEALKTEEDVSQERLKQFGQLVGGGTGAVVSGARVLAPVVKSGASLAAQVAGPTVRRLTQAISGGPQPPAPPAGTAPPGPPSAPGQPPMPEQPPAGPRPPAAPGPTQLGEPGTFPKATGPGSATFNYARSYGLPEIEAGRALTTGKEAGGVWDLLGKRQEALTGIQQRFPTETFVENPRFGGIMTPDQGVGAGPRASYVQQPGGLQAIPTRAPVPTVPPPSVPAPTPSRGALEQVSQLFKDMMGSKAGRAVGTAFRYAAPPLAGFQAGSELGSLTGELQKRQPDYTRAGLHGLGALGAGMSMFPLTAPIGIPLAIGAPLVQAYREKTEGALPVTTETIAP